MFKLSESKPGKFVSTIVAVSIISTILTTSKRAEAIPLYPNDLVNNQVYRLQMEKSAPNGSPVTLNITQQYGFRNGGLVNTWIGADGDSRFKYLTNGYGINFQRENSNYSISVKDTNVTPGNTINSYTSGFGRYQDWNLEKVGGDTYLFHWRTDLDTNLCLDIRGFGQGQQLNNQTPVVWYCDRNNPNQRIRVINQSQAILPPPPPRAVNPLVPGTVMLPGTSIKSNNQCFRLDAQSDGNLVLYRQSNGQALWDSKTYGRNVKQTIFQNDGNLVIYNTSNQPVWASGTDRRGGTRLTVQDDGNFVMYNSQSQALWQTNTVTSCDVSQKISGRLIYLPFDPNQTLSITQGWNTTFTHGGPYPYSKYALDFVTNGRTGIGARATRAGIVVSAGVKSGAALGNTIIVKYIDGKYGLYAHLNSIWVREGQSVLGGQGLGEIGKTGSGSGDIIHLHYEQKSGAGYSYNSTPIQFVELGNIDFSKTDYYRNPLNVKSQNPDNRS